MQQARAKLPIMENTHLPQEPPGARRQTTDASYLQDPKQNGRPTLIDLSETLNEGQQDIPALRHKIDRHIVPIMFLCYLMNLIDKVALNVGTETSRCRTFAILTLPAVCSGYGS